MLALQTSCSSSEKGAQPVGETAGGSSSDFWFPSGAASSTGVVSRDNPTTQQGQPNDAGSQSSSQDAPGPSGNASTAGTSSQTSTATASSTATSTSSASSGSSTADPGNSGGSGKVEVLVAIDFGYIDVKRFDDGTIHGSSRFENPRGEHQRMIIGNRRVTKEMVPGKGFGNIAGRGYVVFNVGQIKGAKGVSMELFVRQKTQQMNGYSFYVSPDESEDLTVYPLDRVSPEDIMLSPPMDQLNHELDVPNFEDLGDGEPYGSLAVSETLLDPTKIEPSEFAVSPGSRDCSHSGSSCGLWISFPLDQRAVDAINQGRGTWGVGVGNGSITWDQAPAENPLNSTVITEWVLVTSLGDFNEGSAAHLMDFKESPPRLRIAY